MPVFQIRVEKIESADMLVVAETIEQAQSMAVKTGTFDPTWSRMEVDFDVTPWRVASCFLVTPAPNKFVAWRTRMLEIISPRTA
jgi:hypothetical protein